MGWPPRSSSAMTSSPNCYQLDIRTYRRLFKQPLLTSHGKWSIREGAIVRITHPQGTVGYGEIAPIPWFGSESLSEALDFCRSLEGEWSPEQLDAIPNRLPACQFALESAWHAIDTERSNQNEVQSMLDICGLLPSGHLALEAFPLLLQQGHTTLKWKIGLASPSQEQGWLQQLRAALPAHIGLRLDANGGFDADGAVQWLQLCDRLDIEFLEQPLPPSEFRTLLQLDQAFMTPIALDESVATLQGLHCCYHQGWRGIYVIKPAICGSPSKVSRFCLEHQLDVVLSSSLESPVGQGACVTLARTLDSHRAIGFGIDHLLQPIPDNWPDCLWLESSTE
ncbi:MAG: o-succinylbenzoate synthase [Synechococcus sp.]